MQSISSSLIAPCLLVILLLFSGCATPTLVETSRRRSATPSEAQHCNVGNDVRVPFQITDWDVLNYTDEVERKLAQRAHIHRALRFGSATGQVTLTSLTAAAATAGWGAATASGLGLGAGFIYSLGQIFDAKGQSQAYEVATPPSKKRRPIITFTNWDTPSPGVPTDDSRSSATRTVNPAPILRPEPISRRETV